MSTAVKLTLHNPSCRAFFNNAVRVHVIFSPVSRHCCRIFARYILQGCPRKLATTKLS